MWSSTSASPAARVIARKGATFYAVAVSVCHICKCLLDGMDTTLTVSTMMHGEYGIEDVCLSVLNTVGWEGVHSKLLAPAHRGRDRPAAPQRGRAQGRYQQIWTSDFPSRKEVFPMEYRIEHDSMGEMKVPADRLWAAQTQRSHENFEIGVGIETMPARDHPRLRHPEEGRRDGQPPAQARKDDR